jgi:hypothetical protein
MRSLVLRWTLLSVVSVAGASAKTGAS